MWQASTFHDEYVKTKNGYLRYWFVCMAGGNEWPCMTAILSKLWQRKFADPGASKNWYKCTLCNAESALVPILRCAWIRELALPQLREDGSHARPFFTASHAHKPIAQMASLGLEVLVVEGAGLPFWCRGVKLIRTRACQLPKLVFFNFPIFAFIMEYQYQ
jgi:hypothetical protein